MAYIDPVTHDVWNEEEYKKYLLIRKKDKKNKYDRKITNITIR